ncbi:Rab family GTPase [Streptomyces marispadix]|uniref:Uncharacterized protein n=1 Tax=Streptomyces marispadix TaxID=2922868 RepID=A0ABS9STH3_9ACTN|nr:hypothetical protein [Streptomyces marispadix]MCH6159366.1 hypothetical protein [Streptomyces marispadix]
MSRSIDHLVAFVSRRNLHYVAVFGAEAVGKTTLLRFWRGQWNDDRPYSATQVEENLGTAKTKVNGRRLMLPSLVDLSGDETAHEQWRTQAQKADTCIYLINAEHLCQFERTGQATEAWQRIEDDAGQIGRWLQKASEQEGGKRSLCILAVTHRDLDERYNPPDEQAYLKLVRSQLELIINKLGGNGRVRTVAGSLDTKENARQLTVRILEQLP